MGAPGPKGTDKDVSSHDDSADIAQVAQTAPTPKHQTNDKPKNGHDSSPKSGINASGNAGPLKHEDEAAQGVDASKTGQALERILGANQALKNLQNPATKLLNDAQNTKVGDDKIASGVQTLLGGIKTAQVDLDQAWPLLHDQLHDLIINEHHPEKEAKETTLHHPGLAKAVHDLTYTMAHLLATTSGIGDARPAVKAQLTEANRTIEPLTLIQGNLGLPMTTYQELVGLVELKVSGGSVNLGTGTPRNQIFEHVMSMSVKWNEMVENMAHGIEKFVRTLDHATLKEAPPGLMEKVWDKALELVKKGATLVSGTPLAADIGLGAINRVIDYGKKLEQARIAQDEDAFINGLWTELRQLKLAGAESGANPEVHDVTQKLDEEFVKIGKSNPEDEWKEGDKAVLGAQAAFLKGLDSRAKQYAEMVPSMEDFESHCLVEFVNASHKLRNNSAWRSPFEGSQSMDGYVQVDLTLYHSGKFVLGRPDAGKLHCPKATGVAKELTQTLGDKLSMWDLNTNLVLKVTTDDVARAQMPEFYAHDRTTDIAMDSSNRVQGAQWQREYWDWIMQQCGTSTYDVLSSIRKLEG